MTAHERTGWRDMELSARHRTWGFNCPSVDLDFLMVEYNIGLPAALVEYKHWRARKPDPRHPTYRALCALADGHRYPPDGMDPTPLPFMLAYYWPDYWAFRILPINETAKRFYGEGWADKTEREFAESLYQIRSQLIDRRTLARLSNTTVAEAELLTRLEEDT